MLTIRRAQMRVLEQTQEERFRLEMAHYLRTHFPHLAAAADGDLLQRVEKAICRGRLYGLTTKQTLCRYLNLCAIFGWNFDRRPENAWMKRMLADPDVTSADVRLNLLVERCLYRMRIEAEKERIARELECSEGEAKDHATSDGGI